MFDVGFWEILLILILALVIIGPERLPAAARQAGLFVGKARRYIEGVRSEVESELDVTEFKRMLHNQEVQINELQQQLKSGMDDIKSDLPDNSILSDDSHAEEVAPDHASDDDLTITPYKETLSRSVNAGENESISTDDINVVSSAKDDKS
jgi:sec-independent protein translocase protein TatB